MVVFPPCKINLGLYVTAKREDGYHDLETIFYPVPFTDALEVIARPTAGNAQLSLSGIPVAGEPQDNLCVKAYVLLKKDFPALPGIDIYLHKQIPSGAGLGGGSADGAFMLTLLDRYFQLSIDNDRLEKYALELGSDCPFFIRNVPVWARGRGEQMERVTLSLNGWYLVLLLPAVAVSTATAFTGCKPRSMETALTDIIQRPVKEWKDRLVNQFEETVFTQYPALAHYKEWLYEQGAVYASMSGTGSAVYGLFETLPALDRLQEEHPVTIKTVLL